MITLNKTLMALATGMGLAMCASVGVAADAEKAGLALVTNGDVVAVNADGVRDLKRRSAVYVDDVVSTGKDSVAQFRMVDGALVALSENSEWSIESYEYAGESSDSVSMKLVKGGLRTISGKVGKQQPENYKLDTPVASIGIRGTHYEVDIINDALLVGVLEGEIAIFAGGCDQNLAAGGLLSVNSSGVCAEPTEFMIEQRAKRYNKKLKQVADANQENEDANEVVDTEVVPSVSNEPVLNDNADLINKAIFEDCDCPDLD